MWEVKKRDSSSEASLSESRKFDFFAKVESSFADSLEGRTAKNEGTATYPKPCTWGFGQEDPTPFVD